MPAKIPATVITGFLGAGKTTMIRHILQNAEGRRIALIINEFGDLGVDGEVLKGCGDTTCRQEDIVELSNGCICCTVADDFIPTMEKLLARKDKPDHIIIETSGLALPQPLISAFNWPEIRTQVTVDGVVTVVDGQAVREGRFAHNIAAVDAQRRQDDNLDHETPLSELFEDQIACADLVVVNKADLLGDEATGELVSQLKAETRVGVQIVTASMGVLPAEVLLGQHAGAEDDISARRALHHHHDDDEDHDDDHHDHDHDEFESFVVERGDIEDAAGFARQVTAVIKAHDILRLKGFAAVKGKPMRLSLQAVGPRIDTHFDRAFSAEEDRNTRLVVIGEAGLDKDAITQALVA